MNWLGQKRIMLQCIRTINIEFKRFSTIRSVEEIINNQKKDPIYAYRQTKSVCNIIKQLFQRVQNREWRHLNQLHRLTKAIHLSNFSQWKNLHDVSKIINYVLNNRQFITELGKKQENVYTLSQILDNLNYELNDYNSKILVQQVISKNLKQQNLKFDSSENIRKAEILSKHPIIFKKLQAKRKMIKLNLLDKIKNRHLLSNNLDQISLANFIKNGLYHGFWQSQFLNSIATIIQSQNTQNSSYGYKSALMAIKLANKNCLNDNDSEKQDAWIQELKNNNIQKSFVVTENKIYNILKQCDYDVSINQRLLNFEVDYKIGQNLIVEYHGIHHYKINQKVPVETIKSQWKVESFRKRGYKVFVIPFYQWNKIQIIYKKKAWLIYHIQKQLLTT